jgi:hypothetical protein
MTLAEAWDLTMRDIEEVKVAISALQAENERLKEEAGENGPELVAALRARIKQLEALTPRNSSPLVDHSKE